MAFGKGMTNDTKLPDLVFLAGANLENPNFLGGTAMSGEFQVLYHDQVLGGGRSEPVQVPALGTGMVQVWGCLGMFGDTAQKSVVVFYRFLIHAFSLFRSNIYEIDWFVNREWIRYEYFEDWQLFHTVSWFESSKLLRAALTPCSALYGQAEVRVKLNHSLLQQITADVLEHSLRAIIKVKGGATVKSIFGSFTCNLMISWLEFWIVFIGAVWPVQKVLSAGFKIPGLNSESPKRKDFRYADMHPLRFAAPLQDGLWHSSLSKWNLWTNKTSSCWEQELQLLLFLSRFWAGEGFATA